MKCRASRWSVVCAGAVALGASMVMLGVGEAPPTTDSRSLTQIPQTAQPARVKFKYGGKEYVAELEVMQHVGGGVPNIAPEMRTLEADVRIIGPDATRLFRGNMPKLTLSLGRQRWSPELTEIGNRSTITNLSSFFAIDRERDWRVGTRLTGKLEIKDGRRSVRVNFQRVIVRPGITTF